MERVSSFRFLGSHQKGPDLVTALTPSQSLQDSSSSSSADTVQHGFQDTQQLLQMQEHSIGLVDKLKPKRYEWLVANKNKNFFKHRKIEK